MIAEKFEIFVPFADNIKLIIRDIQKSEEYIFDMVKYGSIWSVEIPDIIKHERFIYFYLVNDNFVLTDIVGRVTDKNSLPLYSDIRKMLKYCYYDLNIVHVNISKSLSQDNRPVELSNRFNNLDDYINAIYYYDKPKHNINVKIALTKDNQIINMGDIQIKKNSSKILYVIEINEKLDSGDYNLLLFNNKFLLSQITIQYKKLVTYNNVIGDYNLKLNLKGAE